MKIRLPAVEGRFYPALESEIAHLIGDIESSGRYPIFENPDAKVIGSVLPHAGYIYSGYQTVPFFRYLTNRKICPDTFVIIHPNHSGAGPPVAIDGHEGWKNSMGMVQVDLQMNEMLNYPKETHTHSTEHSCEVLLPFIQYYYPVKTPRILPVSMSRQSAGLSLDLANQLSNAATKLNRMVVVLASSDFSHYMKPEDGFRNDQIVIDQILNRDIYGVESVIRKQHISVCGYGPLMTLMAYASLKTEKYQIKILARGHSGEVSPSREVVDYISMLFYS